MSNPVFTGPFEKEMEDFISLKRAFGYKYNTEPGILKRFDTYLVKNHSSAGILTKEAVMRWCAKIMHETPANQCSCSSVALPNIQRHIS